MPNPNQDYLGPSSINQQPQQFTAYTGSDFATWAENIGRPITAQDVLGAGGRLANYGHFAMPSDWQMPSMTRTDQISQPGGGGPAGPDWSQLFGGAGGPSGGGGGISSGHATPGHATSFHAEASLIDTNDPIYSLFAPKPWMSGMLSKGREIGSAQTEDNIRLMHDNAVRAGVSSSSPAYMYMVAMQRRQQAQALANALRDANLAWTLPAADRRAGALGQNASMQTNVSQSNASNDTSTSQANAGYATQASIANAGNATSASIASGQNAFNYAQLGQQGWMFQTNFIQGAWERQQQLMLQLYGAQGPGSGGGYAPPDFGNNALQGAQAGLGLYDLYRHATNPNTNRPVTTPSPVAAPTPISDYPAGD